MTSHNSPTGTISDPVAIRTELLSRLGLPADATDRDVEAARRAAVAMLDRAPEGQKEWAADQLAEVEAVQSLLADSPLDPAEPVDDVVDDDASVVVPPAPRRSKLVWVIAAVLVAVGAAFAFHTMSNANSVPGITGTPDTSSPSAAPSLDQAAVGALMQKISTNPKDVAAYSQLATLYFQAGDYKNAAQFSGKVVALDPKNATGWLALGASQFNQGDATGAEKSWLKVVAINPKNAEAHYDLGFLYLSSAKPDMAKVKAEWQKVVDIDPNADIAKTVKTHLDSLASASASPAASAK